MFMRYFLIALFYVCFVVAGAKVLEISNRRFVERLDRVIAEEIQRGFAQK